MGRIDADDQSVVTVHKTEPQEIILEKTPNRVQQYTDQPGLPPLLEIGACKDGGELVDLLHVLINRVVGIMQDIAPEMSSRGTAFEDELVMRIEPAPGSSPGIPQPEFPGGIPAGVANPFTTIAGQPVKIVPVMFPVLLHLHDGIPELV